MGMYLNPGNENYRESLRGIIYVDKTMMLDTLNGFMKRGNKFICISRPRRFGKTVTQNMLNAYYSKGCDSRELFASLMISSVPCYKENMNQFNVIKIDLNGEYQATLDKHSFLTRLTREIKREMTVAFPSVSLEKDDSLAQSILRIYAETGETFIILIDEYDVLTREKADPDLFTEYLNFLNSLFKNDTLRPAIALACFTGILPIVRDRIQSKLNNFREYTILDARELAPFVGFTSKEVSDLCCQYKLDFEECRRWYDGYRQHGIEIYNPESVVESVLTRHFDNYWGKTSTYAVISDRIRANYEGTKDSVVRMLAGENVEVNVGIYMNTMTDFHNRNDIFTYLIHTGYLAYNQEDHTCRIPNKEIRQEWFYAIDAEEEYRETDRIISESKELLQETILNNNEEAVAKALDRSHIHVTSNRSYNNEDALQSAIYLAYIYALNEYTVIREMTTGKGFADVVFIPFREHLPAMIIELKRNQSPESALSQIREKKYFDSLSHYHGNLLFVGISYDEKTKTHRCRIEKYKK